MVDQEAYYLQQVPQSLYRNTKDQDSGERDPLNIILEPIDLPKEDHDDMRAFIADRVSFLIESLMPEHAVDTVDKDKLLEGIFEKLKI